MQDAIDEAVRDTDDSGSATAMAVELILQFNVGLDTRWRVLRAGANTATWRAMSEPTRVAVSIP